MTRTNLPASLDFQGTALSVVDRSGTPWVTAADVSLALGYSRGDKISRLYNMHAAEFGSDMTAVVETPVSGASNITAKQRIFSARGCHLLAMFARTEPAAAFRRWVLDVLEVCGSAQAAQPERLSEPAYRKDANAFALSYFDQCRALVPKGQKVPEWTHTVDPRIADGLVANTLMSGRWLLSFDHEYRMQMTPVARDACVMSVAQLLKAINEPGGMMIETEQLAEFAAATIKRLAHRATTTMRKTT